MTQKQKIAGLTIGGAIAFIWWYRSHVSAGQPVPSVTTSEGFDLSPYGGPVMYPQAIINFAHAVAKAEGFGLPGAIPTLAHNPGDLKVPNWTGATLGEGISVFNSDDEGWQQLYKQLWLILTNGSQYYTLDMTIRQMAANWTGTQPDAWAGNVAGFLGVSPDTPLYQVLA